jgi:hypothetical protein
MLAVLRMLIRPTCQALALHVLYFVLVAAFKVAASPNTPATHWIIRSAVELEHESKSVA